MSYIRMYIHKIFYFLFCQIQNEVLQHIALYTSIAALGAAATATAAPALVIRSFI